MILIVGDGAERALQTIGTRIDAGGVARTGAVTYLGMTLGDIRGWTPMFHVYAYPSGTTGEAPKHLARADGVIVVEYEEGRSAPFVAAIARPSRAASSTRSEPPAIGLLGSEAFATSWTNAGGPKPDVVARADDADVFPTFKSVAKAILTKLKKSER